MLNSLKLSKLLAVAALALAGLCSTAAVHAQEGYPLDIFPREKLTDLPALQNGAKLFVNYCLSCHSAQAMRFNRLTDLGLTDEQILNNLVLTGGKVGDLMKVAMDPKDAKAWFGANPPDLSVEARARSSEAGSGPDWLYTYLRAYYRDSTRPTGWNNALFENVGMPHVLWQLQGIRGATIEEVKGSEANGASRTTITFDTMGARSEKTEKVEGGGHEAHEGREYTLGKPEGGRLNPAEYDDAVADLVAYLTYMSDPSANLRHRVGVWVLLFLVIFTFITWNLNRLYWKDIK